jgi:hypothetical protein
MNICRHPLLSALSNWVLDGATVRYELKKPFQKLSEMASSSTWRPLAEAFRTACIEFAKDFRLHL